VLDLDDEKTSNPAILGLPPRAELIILARRGEDFCNNLLSLQDLESDSAMTELTAMLESTGMVEGGTVPQWMKDLRKSSEKWLEEMPQHIDKLKQDQNSIRNPLFRFMNREFIIGNEVLKGITAGLKAIIAFVDGQIKATNDLRQLVDALSKEQIPKSWSRYNVGKTGVSHWILDFVKRVGQMTKIVATNYVESPFDTTLWLGGIFSPEGFMAATRQYVAQKNSWPLEDLELNVEIGKDKPAENCFIFSDITLFGAGWDPVSGCLVLTEKTSTALPPSRFRWIYLNEAQKKANESHDAKGIAKPIVKVGIPVYLNPSFKDLLFSVQLPVFSALPMEMWTQRAVSLCVWSN